MIPRLPGGDSTVALLRRGYPFVSAACDDIGADAFRTRLMGRRVVCARGAEAAREFYRPGRFTRRGAMPGSAVRLLQDFGSVQMLDGPEHRRRKGMLLAAIPQHDTAAFVATFRRQWSRAVRRWSRQGRVTLVPAVERVLTATALDWLGAPLSAAEIRLRTAELAAMVAGAGSIGPAHWRALALRSRSEHWAQRLIDRFRGDDPPGLRDRPVGRIARYRDSDGRLLDSRVAAVEVLNVLRPIVAIARYVAFSALALERHPQWHERFRGGQDHGLYGFVQEVRRASPFFPLIGGRVGQPFSWLGHEFAVDEWMLLDLYGTNHDPRLWPDPYAFCPERFVAWHGDPFTLVPQGGGDVVSGHRCPGENVTIAVLSEAIMLLTREMRYRVPAQNLGVDVRRMPTQPHDGFVIDHVRPIDPP